MRIKVGLLVLSVFGLGGAAEAMAQTAPPPECAQGSDQTSYNTGVRTGHAIAQQAWTGLGGTDIDKCNNVERYSSVVVGNVKRLIAPSGSDSFVLCRHAGIVAGVIEEVDARWEQCRLDCCRAGTLTAEMVGELYCTIAIGLQGIGVAGFLPRLPVTFCPFNFETCCDTKFIGYTQAFVDEQGRACRKYTEDPFTAAWQEAQNNMCVSETPPSP